MVQIRQGGEQLVRARSYEENGRPVWRKFSNQAQQRAWSAAQAAYNAEVQRRQVALRAEAERQEAERRRAAELAEQQRVAQAAAAARSRIESFVQSACAIGLVDAASLKVNPFLYEEQTVVAKLHFQQMIERGGGLFRAGGDTLVFVSDLPVAEFAAEADMLLAGEVLGNREITLPFGGRALATHLKFVAAQRCDDETCREWLTWAGAR